MKYFYFFLTCILYLGQSSFLEHRRGPLAWHSIGRLEHKGFIITLRSGDIVFASGFRHGRNSPAGHGWLTHAFLGASLLLHAQPSHARCQACRGFKAPLLLKERELEGLNNQNDDW